MKKMNKKAFTLIELLVVIAVIGILVLLAAPRFIGYTQRAEDERIHHDVKVMEQEIGAMLINNDDDFNSWDNNSKDFNQLIQDNELFEKEGVADEEPIDGPYKIIPEKYKDKINTKLKGTFYANSGGKVYYENGKGPGYSDEEIDSLIKEGYTPIATADEFNSIRNKLDKKYVQVADIDLSKYSTEGWEPIGKAKYDEGWTPNPIGRFTGTYDGGNYVITGLVVNGEGKNYQGLFGDTEGATISNVSLEGINVTGKDYVGGLVGFARGGTTISNSYSTGSVKGVNRVGGLVGWSEGTTISNSYATASVTGTGYDVGGLVGNAYWNTTISNSYATGTVTGSKWDVGGLVGETSGSSTIIENSYATGSVTGPVESRGYNVGGLVGEAYNRVTISNSYATGSVKGTTHVGGLVGDANNSATISNSYATGSVTGSVIDTGTGYNVGGLVGRSDYITIENSYATGELTGSYAVGGLVGSAYGDIIKNSYATGKLTGESRGGGLVGQAYGDINISSSYWDKQTTGQASSRGQDESFGKTTDDMKLKSTYSGWDFEKIWEITPGNYPTLR